MLDTFILCTIWWPYAPIHEGKKQEQHPWIFAFYLQGGPDIAQSETQALPTVWLYHFKLKLQDFSHSKNLVQFNVQVVIYILGHMKK